MTKIYMGSFQGPPGEPGSKGDPGPAGPNTVPTDQAIANAVQTEGSATKAALSGTYVTPNGPTATAANTQRFLTKLYRGIEDASVLHIGTSLGNETIEYVNLTWTQFAARFPTHTFIIHGWDETGGAAYDTGSAGSATTIQTGTGPRTVNIWRCCAAGKRTDYTLGSRWQAAVVAPAPDLIFVEHGKNEGSLAAAGAAMWRGQYLALTESLARVHPYAGIVLILEPLNTTDNDMALKNRVYEEIAQLRGYGVVNVHDAFLATGHPNDYIKVDGIHPTTSADAPAPNGSQLMADCILGALRLDVRTGAISSQQASSFATQASQLLSNGNFSAFTGSAPDGWVLSGAATSKDVRAGYFESAQGYAVRLQATGAAQSLMRKDAVVAAHKGKWVTLAVRMRVAAGLGGTVGRISLSDGMTYLTSSAALSDARDGFHWKVLTLKVAPTAAYLRAIVYGDTAANASADVTIDGVYLVEGVLPRFGSEGVAGPAGPAGSGSPTQVDHLSTFGTNPVSTLVGASGSVVQNAANQAILTPFKPQRDMSIALLQWVCSVTGGNYDIGIYDIAGNRLWSKGSAAFPAAGALQADAVSPAVALTAGTTYYLAFTADGTTGGIRGVTQIGGFSGMLQLLDGTNYARLVSAAFPLPATITVGGTGSVKIPAVVFREA